MPFFGKGGPKIVCRADTYRGDHEGNNQSAADLLFRALTSFASEQAVFALSVTLRRIRLQLAIYFLPP